MAILVHLGGAETNSENAVEMLHAERRGRAVACNAPVVEGESWPPPRRPAFDIGDRPAHGQEAFS